MVDPDLHQNFGKDSHRNPIIKDLKLRLDKNLISLENIEAYRSKSTLVILQSKWSQKTSFAEFE